MLPRRRDPGAGRELAGRGDSPAARPAGRPGSGRAGARRRFFPRWARCTPNLAASCRRKIWMAWGLISIRCNRFHAATSNRQPGSAASVPRTSTPRSRRSRPTWDGTSPAARSRGGKETSGGSVGGGAQARIVSERKRTWSRDLGWRTGRCRLARNRAYVGHRVLGECWETCGRLGAGSRDHCGEHLAGPRDAPGCRRGRLRQVGTVPRGPQAVANPRENRPKRPRSGSRSGVSRPAPNGRSSFHPYDRRTSENRVRLSQISFL